MKCKINEKIFQITSISVLFNHQTTQMVCFKSSPESQIQTHKTAKVYTLPFQRRSLVASQKPKPTP